MSEVPLTFNNGQTETTSEIVAVQDGGRKKEGADRNKSYLVTTLIKDGVDENNRPLYKRDIRAFNSVAEAKNFKSVVESDGLNSEAFIGGGTGTVIATGSTKDGQKTFEFTENATKAQKNQVNQIKNATSKQVENIGRDEGGAVLNHTTEFAKKKVGENKDNSIDAKDTAKQEAEDRSGLGRKQYSNMFYPSFIQKSNQDKLQIKILKKKISISGAGDSNRRDRMVSGKPNNLRYLPYDIPKGSKYYDERGKLVSFGRAEAFSREQDRVYAQGENVKLLEYGKETIGRITLPIPNGVSDQNSVSFGQGTLNPVQRAISDTALKTILSGVGEGGKTAAEIFKKTVTDPNTKKALAGFIAGTASGIDPNELLSRTEGVVFNNNLALLFKSPTLRPFTFQFNLSPRDRGEAVQVQKIIRAFKQSSAVQRTKGEIFLAAPNTYALQFFKGPTPHQFLPQIKECALLSVGVNYMPENSYMTYEDSSMVSYSLSLSFQELAPIFNSDYDDLDEGVFGVSGVGESGIPLAPSVASALPDSGGIGF